MSKKEVLVEGILVLLAYLLSMLGLTAILYSYPNHLNLLESIIGTDAPNASYSGLLTNLSPLYGLVLFFPSLFCLQFVLVCVNRFRKHSQHVFLLFISAVSMLVTCAVLSVLHSVTQMMAVFSGNIFENLGLTPKEPGIAVPNYEPHFQVLLILQALVLLLSVFLVFKPEREKSV